MKDSDSAVPPASGLDVSIVAALAEIAARHDLSEVEVEHNGLKIRVARERRAAPVAQIITAPALAAAPIAHTLTQLAPPAATPADGHPGAVKSPMVGTAYLRPSPESRPFIEVGSTVKAGDKLMLVEAMKTYNEIVAPRAGKIAQILVEDGSPVEYGQPLMVIE
jgi:acetyl-CoA carboxylase biotin carboxyl carrier protein